ncbi:MAG TPA: choice-of-anchor Q domain-containing protein [bacterium]|nr:choice-of-anchor Q domain-containing protein [bacterium]
MNTMIRIAFLAALLLLVASCEFYKDNDLLEELKKDPPVAGADTDTDKDDVTPDVDNAATCGNSTVDGTEECDFSTGVTDQACDKLDGDQYSSGLAHCDSNCMWNRSDCVPKNCGDGTVQTETEECDTSLPTERACVDIDPEKYKGGTATCGAVCKWDISDCVPLSCGNGALEEHELCDNSSVEGGGVMQKPCADIDDKYYAGPATCDNNCHWDLSECLTTGCGDGTVVAPEQCEGTEKEACVNLGANYVSGQAECDPTNCQWMLSGCKEAVCGDSTVEGNETCDGGAKPCIQVDPETWASGDAYCNSSCNGWDTDACEPKPEACTCGNGTVDGVQTGCGITEVCETNQTTTCDQLGFDGNMTEVDCKNDCTGWDTSVCDQVQVVFDFDTPFILDGSKRYDEIYLDSHADGVITTGVFSGNWENDAPIPPTNSLRDAIVFRSTDSLPGPALIVQESYFEPGMNYKTPARITLNFPTDDVLAGGALGLPLTMQLGLAENAVKLFAQESDGNGFCLKHVATSGSFKITAAENTMAIEGGTISGSSEGQYIPLTAAAVQNIGQDLQLGYTFYRVCGGQSCGDGIINGGEQCDIDDLVEFDCAKISKTYSGGTATCDSSTCQWDFTQCQAAPICGDNNIDDGEVCDDGNATPGDGCSSNCKFVDNNCAAITAGSFLAQMGTNGVNGDMAMFVAEFTPAEGSGSLPEMFFFYIDTDFIPVKSQAYPITEAVKNDYGLQAMTDYDGMNGTVGTAFAAYAGQMHFTDYDLDGNGKFTDSAWGQADLVYFGEIDQQGHWVQNGQCRYLASASWDTIDYPVITDLSASYSGAKDNIQIQWTAPNNASRYNQYRICVDTTNCVDVTAGMSPGGTEVRNVGVSWYSGTHTISVQPLRDGSTAANAAAIDVDTNGHAVLAPETGIDFGLVGYNSYLERTVTVINTATLVDLVINETTLPMDCAGKVTIISGNVAPGSQVTVDPGEFHAVGLRYAPTETSTCTDGQFRAQWILTDIGANKTYDETTLPVTGQSANTPPVITEAYFSPNPVKNADNATVIRVYFEDDNGVCNGIGTDIVEAVWDMRELGGGPREEMWNSSCATDTHQFWFWKSIDVSALGNGIYVIPLTITDSAGHTVRGNASFAVYSGNILEVGDGKTYADIKSAVNAAGNYDVITVYPGTYTGTDNSDINPGGKQISIYGINGPNETIIDAVSMLNPTFAIDHDNGNLYIGGFSLRHNPGGAMWMGAATTNQKVTVTNCRFEENSNSINGGGIVAANDKVDLTVAHSVFSGNSVGSYDGGAVYASAGAKMLLVDVLFDGNGSSLNGGAVALLNAGAVTFDRVVFTGNTTTYEGGALYIDGGQGVVELRNTIFAQNASTYRGGAIHVTDTGSAPPTVKIYNSTIAENTAGTDAGGIYLHKGNAVIKDSIVFSNTGGSGLPSQLYVSSDISLVVTVDYTAIGGAPNPILDSGNKINAPDGFVAGAHNNIIDDPLFLGGTTGGVNRYRLTESSPCIDVGSDGSTVPTYDFLGYSRYNVAGKGDGTGIENDMGAFEYQVP